SQDVDAKDVTARLWDAASGKERWSYRGYSPGSQATVAFTPDGKTVGAIGWGSHIRLLCAATGSESAPLPAYQSFPDRLAITPDGKRVITPGVGASLYIWEVANGKLLRTLREPRRDEYDPVRRVRTWHGIEALNLTPDGKALLVGDSQGLRPWDLSKPD